jgi:hypothetical protein
VDRSVWIGGRYNGSRESGADGRVVLTLGVDSIEAQKARSLGAPRYLLALRFLANRFRICSERPQLRIDWKLIHYQSSPAG